MPPSLCPWPNVTCYYSTKQSFLSCAPLAALSLRLTCCSPHHYQRSVYKGPICSLAHENCQHFKIFLAMFSLPSNVYVCTINPGTEKSYFSLEEKELANVASWVFQCTGGWIWTGHAVCTSGRGVLQIFLMTQFLTARISFWLLGGAKSPEVSASHLPSVSRAWYSPNSFQVKKARIFVQPHWLSRLVGVTWPRRQWQRRRQRQRQQQQVG